MVHSRYRVWGNGRVMCLRLCSPLLSTGRFFSFLSFYTVGKTPWAEDQQVTKPLPAHRTAQTQNKRKQTSMSQVGFEPMIPAFERAKVFYALDRAATVIRGHVNTARIF
jgi:hypothetical protein